MIGQENYLSKLNHFKKDNMVNSTAVTQISNQIWDLIAHLQQEQCCSSSLYGTLVAIQQKVEKMMALFQSFRNRSIDFIESLSEQSSINFLKRNEQIKHLTLDQRLSNFSINDIIQYSQRIQQSLLSKIAALENFNEVLINQNTELKEELIRNGYLSIDEQSLQDEEIRQMNHYIDYFLQDERQLPSFPQSPILRPIRYSEHHLEQSPHQNGSASKTQRFYINTTDKSSK